MACNKNHRYLDSLMENFENNQGDNHNERHKCAGCAYVDGLKDALNGTSKKTQLDASIPESQAGATRHKDAWVAYEAGYAYGRKIDS